MKRSLIPYLIALFCLQLLACEKAFLEEEYDESDPFESFDYLVGEVDRHYSFFGVKQIDWNAISQKHRAGIYPGISQDSLFNLMGSLLKSLKDDHANLRSSFNVAAYRVPLDASDNFDFRIVQDNYIGRDFYVSGPFIHEFIAAGEIGYIRLGSFTGTANAVNLDFVFSRYRNTKGLILDLRENGGGSIQDVFDLLSKFINNKTVVFKSRIRNGPGHEDFSALEDASVEAAGQPRYTNRPVMVLIDRGSYSASSFFALATKTLPNVTLVGDTSGGGLGLPNGGHLPNGWFYRFSVTQALSLDQAARLEAGQMDQVNAENYENGVPPDILVGLDRSDVSKDEIIDRAIQEILN